MSKDEFKMLSILMRLMRWGGEMTVRCSTIREQALVKMLFGPVQHRTASTVVINAHH